MASNMNDALYRLVQHSGRYNNARTKTARPGGVEDHVSCPSQCPGPFFCSAVHSMKYKYRLYRPTAVNLELMFTMV